MSKQKGFTLVEGLLVVLILSVVGFAGYYVWNQNQEDEPKISDTVQQENQEESVVNDDDSEAKNENFKYVNINIPNDWKTYENAEYKFSFQYPANFNISESTFNLGESADEAIFSASANPPAEQGVGGYEVRILSTTLEDAVKNDGLNVNDNQYKNSINEKDIYVSGHKAIELSYIPDGGKVSWFFIEIDNNAVIRFALVEDSGVNAEESKAIYNSLTIE